MLQGSRGSGNSWLLRYDSPRYSQPWREDRESQERGQKGVRGQRSSALALRQASVQGFRDLAMAGREGSVQAGGQNKGGGVEVMADFLPFGLQEISLSNLWGKPT